MIKKNANTPGIILTVKALVDKNISPTDEEISEPINCTIWQSTV